MATELIEERSVPINQDPGFALLSALRKIVSHISEHSKQIKRESGLTVPQLMVLKTIGDMRGQHVTIHAVAETVHLTDATVSRIVERLVRAGQVIRERGKKDRRKVRLTLSETGMEKYRSLPQPLQEDFLARYSALAPEQRREIMDCLAMLAEMMGDDQDDDS